MIVVDASVWATALADSGRVGHASRAALELDPDWLMPAHGPTEVLRTLRRFEVAGHLTPDEATRAAREVSSSSTGYASPDPSMLINTWSLRHNISLYDAAYVVLAAMHGCPLVTLDRRLGTTARAKGVHVIEPGAQES